MTFDIRGAEDDNTLVTTAEVQDVLERSCIGLSRRDRISHTLAVLLNAIDASPDLPKPMKAFMRDLLVGPSKPGKTSKAMLQHQAILKHVEQNGPTPMDSAQFEDLHDLAMELGKAAVGTMLRQLECADWTERVDVVMGYGILHTVMLLDGDKDGEIREFGGTCQGLLAMLESLKQTLPMPA